MQCSILQPPAANYTQTHRVWTVVRYRFEHYSRSVAGMTPNSIFWILSPVLWRSCTMWICHGKSLDIPWKCANFCTSIHFAETVMWLTFRVTTLQHRQTSVNLSLEQSDGLLDHCLSCMLPVLWIRLKRQHLDWFNGWKAHLNDLTDCQTESVQGLILYYAPHENSVLL